MGDAGNDEGSVEDGRGWYGGWDTGLRVIGFRGREGGGGEGGHGVGSRNKARGRLSHEPPGAASAACGPPPIAARSRAASAS